MRIPIVYPLQKGPERDLVVIGYRKAAGRRSIKAYQNGAVRVLQLVILSEAQQRTFNCS